MSLGFINRVSKYPNRYKVTAEDGSSYYVTLERADEPTTEGTPLNAAILNQLATLADVKKLPNMHVWKQYKGDPSKYTQSEVTQQSVSSRLDMSYTPDFADVIYGDAFTASNGVITLTNEITISTPTISELEAVKGKYVAGAKIKGGLSTIYYIPEDATFSQVTRTQNYLTYKHLVADTATKIEANQYIGYVMDEASDAYPAEGTHEDDGYWYAYHKQFGD